MCLIYSMKFYKDEKVFTAIAVVVNEKPPQKCEIVFAAVSLLSGGYSFKDASVQGLTLAA